MQDTLLSLLADPTTRQPLRLAVEERTSGGVIGGRLHGGEGRSYPIVAGIPRFVTTTDAGQLQTQQAFGFKWSRRGTYDSAAGRGFSRQWCAQKYGFGEPVVMDRYFAGRTRILDVGCGSGYSSSLWLESPEWTGSGIWVGVDISEAIDVARDRLAAVRNAHFIQADALQLPFSDGSFDTVFSEGVFHHTPSTRAALESGVRVLKTGGEILFYVYRRKGPIREFADDYIRGAIAGMTDERAWEEMRSLTELGRALSELRAVVHLDREVPLLGIKAGDHDAQRLVYWHFAKLFWNADLGFEENVHVNFDWYRPRYAHRQSTDEVRDWCRAAGLLITWLHEEESGITVRAVKV